MNNKTILGILAILIVVVTIGSVSAFGGKFFGMNPETQNNIANAIKTNNYTAWKDAMSAQLTQENFNKLVQRMQTMSQRHGNMSEKLALNQEMNQAIKDGNYNAWKTAAQKANSSMISKIDTQDKFNTLVQLYQAKQDGNSTKVKELSAQLGLTGGFGKHMMSGFGRGRNN